MENKKKKIKKIIAAIIAFILIGIILFLANGMVGNPISKMLVNKAAEKYVAENYSDLDLELEKAVYDFKDGGYYVRIASTSSIDTHFVLNYSWAGELERDQYESLVLSKWNTWRRIDDEYHKLVDSEIEDKMDLDEREFIYGEFTKEDNFSELEIDKKYNVKKLAKEQGHIQLTMEKDTLDVAVMVETLNRIKEIFDEEDISFNTINVDLHEPRRKDANQESLLGADYLMLKEFLYTDIYRDGLEKRVEKNIEETKQYYNEQDDVKKKEKEAYEKDIKDEK
jgi:hypothetical protein